MHNEKLAFDIIVQAGQSNAQGCGIGPVAEEYVPNENIYCLTGIYSDVTDADGKRSITYDNSKPTLDIGDEFVNNGQKTGELAFTFADAYVKNGLLAEGRKVLILRTAIGGTCFKRKEWGPGCPVEERMHELIAYALAMNPENRIVAFLWHQGESDCYDDRFPLHPVRLSAIIDGFRADLGLEDVPFLVGGLGDYLQKFKGGNIVWSNNYRTINSSLKHLAESKPHMGFVSAEGLTSNPDYMHFTAESLLEFGRRYYRVFETLEDKNRIFAEKTTMDAAIRGELESL